MIVEFDKSFLKSLQKIKDTSIHVKIESSIILIENAVRLESVTNVKKLKGHKTYYRLKIGDYRLGFEKLDAFRVRFIVIAHRKDIYNNFP